MPSKKTFGLEILGVARFLLRTKPAEIGATLLSAVGLHMIYGDDYILGITTLSFSAIWGIFAWWFSDKLQEYKPQPPKKQKYIRVEKYKRARQRYLFLKFSIPLVIVVALVLLALLTNNKREGKILKEYEGFLLPANEPDPPSFCSEDNGPSYMRISKDALKIFIGRNEAFGARFPYVVLRARHKDRIVVDRDETGRIALTVDIFDKEGKVIVTFEKGHFTVVQTDILDMKRSDRSTLIVRDRYKNEVLNVRYLNKRSLRFSGLLQYPGVGFIPIPKTAVVNGICAGNADVAYDIE
jgi:hypothetical protein